MTQYLNKASTPLHVDILGFVISIKYIEECLYSFLLTVCDISTHNFNVVFESYSLMEGIFAVKGVILCNCSFNKVSLLYKNLPGESCCH